MKDAHNSFDCDVKSLACLHARYDWDPYGKMLFILSISNYPKNHMYPFVHIINIISRNLLVF